MKTGCPDCDKAQKQAGNNIEMCDKHYLKYLEWIASAAQKDLKAERERQNELSSS